MLYPYLVVAILGSPGGDRLELAGHACILLADLLVLGAGITLAVDARLSYDGLRASMAIAATLVAVQDAPLVVLGLIEPSLRAHSYRLTDGHLVTVLIVLVVIHRGRRAGAPGPRVIATGIVLGLVALGTTLGLNALLIEVGHGSGFLEVGHPPDLAQMVLIGVALAAIGLQLWWSSLPRWAAVRIGVGILAIFAARLYSTLLEATTPPPAAIVGVVLFSALTVTTAASLLRASLDRTSARVSHFAHLAAEAEAEVKQDREVAHEVRAAAAGLAAAARLLANGHVPAGPRRDALERMVELEAGRLRRTVTSQPGPLTTIAVDAVVSPIVVAQATLGHAVTWQPAGHRVLARRDALAEALGVLVNNAARHGGGRGTTITSRVVGDRVEIVVSDSGPGVEPAVRSVLFEWGAHHSRSEGQGIGLHRAHRLIQEQGGTLDLADAAPNGGAAFVISLPRGDTHWRH